jgi:hypothetical protein
MIFIKPYLAGTRQKYRGRRVEMKTDQKNSDPNFLNQNKNSRRENSLNPTLGLSSLSV